MSHSVATPQARPYILRDRTLAVFLMDHPVIAELAKATPPATVVAMSWFYGIQWSQIAYFMTALYTAGLIIQQGYRAYKWWHARKQAKKYRRPLPVFKKR